MDNKFLALDHCKMESHCLEIFSSSWTSATGKSVGCTIISLRQCKGGDRENVR